MNRLLETFFRHKLLLLLPPLLVTAIVTPVTLLTSQIYYESWASIWVDKPTYLNYSNDWNQWLSPAQNQSAALGELLRTQTFLRDLAKQTSLAPLASTARGMDRVQTMMNDGLTLYPTGSHLLVLRMRAASPQIAFQVLNALVETFKDSLANSRANQASLATSFYQGQMEAAQVDLDKAGEDLRRYMAANPRLGDASRGIDPAALNAAMITDPQLAQLQQTYTQKQQELDRLRGSLRAAQFDASASLEAQDLGFQVVDAPQMPTTGGRDLKKRIVYPIAGLLAGIGLSTILLVLLAAADRSVRSETDLAPGLRLLGVVPRLKLKQRVPRALRVDAPRRAIGFVAGAALPAPDAGR